MDGAEDFCRLVEGARDGNEEASTALYSQFAPSVMRFARAKLASPVLRQRIDEADICQSVFSEFFSGLRVGRFVIETSQSMEGLLIDITHKFVLRQLEKHSAGKRDVRKQAGFGEDFDPMGAESTASAKVSREEQVNRFLSSLSEEDRYVFEQRKLGRDWDDLAAELKTSPDALRVRLGRATKAAFDKLG